MRIISWNIYNKNTKIFESMKFILGFKPDVICIQEFPNKNLNLFEKFNEYNFISAKDCRPVDPLKPRPMSHLAIGIKKNIKHTMEIFKFEGKKKSFVGRLLGVKEGLQYMKINIGKYHLFNAHFSLAVPPSQRIKELKQVINKFENKKNIVCGDFNNFTNKKINFFIGWAFGFKKRDYFMNEKDMFQEMYEKHNLINVFTKKTTHKHSRLQLDHILLPECANIKNQELIKYKYSDHKPIMVDIE